MGLGEGVRERFGVTSTGESDEFEVVAPLARGLDDSGG